MNYNHPELLDRLAAAYVFGSLTGRTRRRFARLRRTLPAADAAVREWEARTAALAAAVPPVKPSPQLWQAIDRRTGGTAQAAKRPRSWADWLRPALGFAFGVMLTVGVMRHYPEQVLSTIPASESLPESYVGLLVDTEGKPTVLASATRHGRRMTIKMLQPVAVPPGKVLRLWALPKDAPPFALGVVPASGKGSFTMAGTSEQLLSKVPRLGVTLDDAQGAAPAAPSAFVLTGHCVKLW